MPRSVCQCDDMIQNGRNVDFEFENIAKKICISSHDFMLFCFRNKFTWRETTTTNKQTEKK